MNNILDKIIKGLMLSKNNLNDIQIIEYIKNWIIDNKVEDIEIIIFKQLWEDICLDNYYNLSFNKEEYKLLFTILNDKEFNKITNRYKSKITPIILDNIKERGSGDVLSICSEALAYGPYDLKNSELNDDEYPYWWIIKK